MLEDEVPSKTYAASGAALSPPEKMETATRTLRHVAGPLLSGLLEPRLVNLEKGGHCSGGGFQFPDFLHMAGKVLMLQWPWSRGSNPS